MGIEREKIQKKYLLLCEGSVKDEFVSFKIGEAAKAHAFDWKSKKLDDFRELLLGFFD